MPGDLAIGDHDLTVEVPTDDGLGRAQRPPGSLRCPGLRDQYRALCLTRRIAHRNPPPHHSSCGYNPGKMSQPLRLAANHAQPA